MLKKLFKTKPIQEKESMTETHESHADKARAKVRETVKKINQAELDLADSAIAYQAALKAGDEKTCLAELEQQDIVRRSLRLYNDQLPLHQAAVEEAEKLDAAPEIAAMCVSAQELCTAEELLINEYYAACEKFKNATEALTHQSHRTNQALITLKHEIDRVGSTVRPAVNRARFVKPMHVVENGRQLFAHFTERSITAIEEKRP